MENYICIDGVKTKLSCETAESLKRDFAFEKSKELRNGDYGYRDNKPIVMLKKNDYSTVKDGQHFQADEDRVFSNSMESHTEGYAKTGNIFDDLERNSKDLEEFGVGYEDGSKDNRIQFALLKDRLQMRIGHEYFTTALGRFVEIHQKLGQLIATAKRREAKKEC